MGFLAGASMVRRSAFLQAGGFEPRFFIGGEEELLSIDLASRGWWLCYVPEIVVHHYPSPRRDVFSRRWHLVRNALWFAWLRRPFSSAVRRTWHIAHTMPRDLASLRGFAAAEAASLVSEVARVAEAAPFRHLVTPGGFTMSVAMTNCGKIGWVSLKQVEVLPDA